MYDPFMLSRGGKQELESAIPEAKSSHSFSDVYEVYGIDHDRFSKFLT